MANVDKKKFSLWLYGQLLKSELADEVPSESMGALCDHMASTLRGNRFNAKHLVDWLASEYGLAPERIVAVLSKIQPAASEVGVEFGFWTGDDPGPVQGGQGEEVDIKPTYDGSINRSLDELMKDVAFWKGVYINYATNGQTPDQPMIAGVLAAFEPTEKEKEILNPSEDDDDLTAELHDWIITVNSRSVACEYFSKAVAANLESDEDALKHTLSFMIDESATLVPKIMHMLQKGRKGQNPSTAMLQSAFNRFQKTQKSINQLYDEMSGRQSPAAAQRPRPAPGAPPPLPPRPSGRSEASESFMEKNQKLLILGVILLTPLAILFMLYRLGYLTETVTVKDVQLDFSGVGLTVERSRTDGTGLVVNVATGSWNSLSDDEKKDKVKALYRIAQSNRLSQVQVRSSGDKMLAQSWGPDRIVLIE